MAVAIAVSVLGLLVVLVVFYRDTALDERAPAEPDWELLPTPSEITRVEFPLAFPGYDPATVELHLDRLARAYGDLLAVAPADVVARARQRAAVRAGGESRAEDGHAVGADSALAPLTPLPRPDEEALRTEAALAGLETPGRRDPTLSGY